MIHQKAKNKFISEFSNKTIDDEILMGPRASALKQHISLRSNGNIKKDKNKLDDTTGNDNEV